MAGIDWNEISAKSNGGTEQVCRKIEATLPKDLLDQVQIIPSRVRELDPSKIRILYCHDLPPDPESAHLKNEGWKRFHRIVFVSHWQREWYVRHFNIPPSHTIIMQNAIYPIEAPQKPSTEKLNLIYHTTPHRGLELLVPVFKYLAETDKNIHLDVYSSFEIYGWANRDEPYKKLFEDITSHPQMTYHGFKPNDEVREALRNAHIFAYPNVWMETSCLALMEAMSAECMCVHPDFGALPETAANWTYMYAYNEDHNAHANTFLNVLKTVMEIARSDDEAYKIKLKGAKSYCDLFYNWETRKAQWEVFIKSLLHLPRELPVQSSPMFHYRAS